MAEERKRVAPKTLPKPEPRTRERVIPIEEPIIEPKIQEDESLKPERKTRTRKKVIEEPKVEPVTKVKPIPKAPRKTVLKPEPPKAPVKKLTKKQIEKQIEQEKVDVSVPQVAPKKTENFIMDSIPSTKRSEDKYIRIATNAPMDERKVIADKVTKNEVSLSHYAIDGELGFHYYLVIKK